MYDSETLKQAQIAECELRFADAERFLFQTFKESTDDGLREFVYDRLFLYIPTLSMNS